MSTESISAAAEEGPVAVVVWCATCGAKGKPLGQVRRSSAGLVFDARLVGDVTFAPGHREALLERFHRDHGRLPIPVAVGRSVILIEDPDDTPGDEPAVECPRCGRVELPRADLVAAAGRQTKLNRPVKVLVFE